jgi:hypothetical protein
MRWRLLGDRKLLGTKAGNADHAHIAVAPILRRDPLDQIVGPRPIAPEIFPPPLGDKYRRRFPRRRASAP